LLLRYVADQRKAPVAALDLADLDTPHILAFLSHLEDRRKNSVATRNVRLAAFHAFFRFVASRNPEQLELAQKVIAVPFKRAPTRAIDYL
jgi:site-specific recombinase XerD